MKSSRATISPRKEQGSIAEEKDIKQCTTSTNLSVLEDDFNGISITSLAKSLAKNRLMPQNIEMHRPSLVQRKLYVSPPDPRPGKLFLISVFLPFPTSISDLLLLKSGHVHGVDVEKMKLCVQSAICYARMDGAHGERLIKYLEITTTKKSDA